VRVLSPAKINLLLKVLGKRNDGYHELLTLMVPVTLFDTLYLEQAEESIELDAPGCGCSDTDNLVFKAADLFRHKTEIKNGIKIRIDKKIPIGAGLGGGSSNAAHTLVALNKLFCTGIKENQLSEMAQELGADCPFFIHGRPAIMGGRGDSLLADTMIDDRVYLIVIPPFGISTARIFSEFKMPLTNSKDVFKIEDITKKSIAPERYLFNELEVSAFGLHPELKTVKEDLVRAGALGALMSGSGSAVFGVFEDAGHLEHAMIKLRKREGYEYIPTTRTLGGINGNYRS
jgi:4-diphosphocytidyl-2-C-methyl-D-erythritol kinase